MRPKRRALTALDGAQELAAALRPLVEPEVGTLLWKHDLTDGGSEVEEADATFLVRVKLVEHALESHII
jgi:hypothetical protein